MAAEDYFPEGWESTGLVWFSNRTAQTISCRYCKQKPMFWVMDSHGWYLKDTTGARHDCRARNAGEELVDLN